jgi:hypothetical protein
MARRSEAFQALGAPLRNIQRHLSSRVEDRLLVVVSLWEDELTGLEGSLVYDRADTDDWADGYGKRDFFRDLQWAIDHCGGQVRVVLSVRNPSNPHKAIDSYPRPDLVMRITRLDVTRGSFRLESVAP